MEGDAGNGLGLELLWVLSQADVEIRPASKNIEIKLEIEPSVCIFALVTNRTVTELNLIPGSSVTAIINHMSVMLVSTAMARRITGRNKIEGKVASRKDSAGNSEITLNIGNDKTIEAVIASNTADEVEARLDAKSSRSST